MNVKYIIIHCSATSEGRAFTKKDIEYWHKMRGFRCIGYHYVVGIGGEIEQGRQEHEIGAHCLNHNAHSIGVCYVGGLERDGKTPKDTRTYLQKLVLKKLLKQLKDKYPNAEIVGHNEFANKACPCFNAREEYKDL